MMRRLVSFTMVFSLGLFVYCEAQAARSDEEMIATAESAAPEVISNNAAIKTMDGRVLREGSNGWTCYPGNAVIGPMCNEPQWCPARPVRFLQRSRRGGSNRNLCTT